MYYSNDNSSGFGDPSLSDRDIIQFEKGLSVTNSEISGSSDVLLHLSSGGSILLLDCKNREIKFTAMVKTAMRLHKVFILKHSVRSLLDKSRLPAYPYSLDSRKP